MPAPVGRDLDATRASLERWLRKRLPRARDLQVSNLAGPGTTGFSNDTLMFDLVWQEGDAQHREALVLRLEPGGGDPVFQDYDLAAQYRIQSRLADTGVPVPRMFGEERDPGILGAPFYVMERVEGRIPSDSPPYHVAGWLTEAGPDERERIWWSGLDVLARIHRLDWKELGLAWLERPGNGDGLERELAHCERYLRWAWGDAGGPHPVCGPALDWLRANRPREPQPTVLCWGDARIGNMIFREGRCVAVLDWEMAVLGSPEMDFGWWLYLDHHHSAGVGAPRLAGFPSREASIARYEERSGHRCRNLAYYEALAAFRFSAIMIRVARRMMQQGILPADSRFDVENPTSRLLAEMLDLPVPG